MTAAAMAELAGAGQITIHLREDRRHIQDRDLKVLRATVQTLLNLEMAATQDMVKVAYEHKPDMVTLVPERREELTTEGGLDVNSQRDTLSKVVKNLKDGDITVSLFIDPDLDQVKAAHKVGAARIELHTGRFCEARTEKDRQREFSRIVDAAKSGWEAGLGLCGWASTELRQRATHREAGWARRVEHWACHRRTCGAGRFRPRRARDGRPAEEPMKRVSLQHR